MKNFWFTPRQAATALGDLTGKEISPDGLREILSPSEMKGSLFGVPLMNGKLFGPMFLRAAHAKLLRKRSTYLNEELHSGRPPIVVSHYAKGGSGKTSAVANAAIALCQRGMRVLVIDADPQASATTLFGVDVNDESLYTLYDLVFGRGGEVLLDQAIIPLVANGVLDLIPADPLLANFDAKTQTVAGGRDYLFDRVLKINAEALKRYDVVLIDTNPATSSPLNIILAIPCDALLMSIPMDALSMKSRRVMDKMFTTLEDARATAKQVLVLANAFAATTSHGKISLADLVRNDREVLMQTVIPFSSAVARQGWEKKAGGGFSVVEREPTSLVARRYVQFALELLEYTLWQPRNLGALSFAAPEIESIEAELASQN